VSHRPWPCPLLITESGVSVEADRKFNPWDRSGWTLLSSPPQRKNYGFYSHAGEFWGPVVELGRGEEEDKVSL
jgi:hypothetical protein